MLYSTPPAGVDVKRDPRTPDCPIKGCTRAARRLGMCDEHSRLAPITMSLEIMMECFEAQMRVKRKHHRRAIAHVRRELAARRG
jgi:hypothetical protein